MALYHKDIGFPTNMRRPRTAFLLDYTHHARQEAARDRYGHIELPRALDCRRSENELIECDVDDATGDIIKAVWRMPFNDELDIVLVVLMRRKLVKTVWLNRKDDKHNTLDRSRYAVPTN